MHPALIFGAIALLAWLNQPAPEPVKVEAPKPPVERIADRVILLPDADGTAGAIIVRANSGAEQRIDRAYLAAEVSREGSLTLSPQDPAAVQARYGELLSARPAAPVSYLVYFLAGSSNTLTPESRSVLDQMKAELARRPVPEVQVIGHTDRVGRVEANDELSLRRADAVRDLLVGAGIPRDQIDTSGRGEREPLVPTADEVAEPRNRRVEISVR